MGGVRWPRLRRHKPEVEPAPQDPGTLRDVPLLLGDRLRVRIAESRGFISFIVERRDELVPINVGVAVLATGYDKEFVKLDVSVEPQIGAR